MAALGSYPDETAMRRLLRWIDGIDLPMFVLVRRADGELEFLHANAALGRVAGLPNDLFAGKSAAELFPPRLAEQLNGNYRACLDGDQPVSYEECMLIDGRETWWQTTLSKPDGFDGKVILGVAVSTTASKEREFAAAGVVAEMTSRFDELHLFSTMAAHDARSPLATVSSLVDLVLEDFNDMGDGKVELLRLISSTVDEALEQIGATLERGRAMNGSVNSQSSVDLGHLCGDIAAMVDPEKALRIDVPDVRVECDEVIVQMGLRNLMSNASRYCKTRISVVLKQDEVRGHLLIDVVDDGPGLPPGTTLRDLTQEAEAQEGSHGFGLRKIAQLAKSRGGSLELMPPLLEGDLTGARFRLEVPGRVQPNGGAGHGTSAAGTPKLAKAS